jgi:hypothetical protein
VEALFDLCTWFGVQTIDDHLLAVFEQQQSKSKSKKKQSPSFVRTLLKLVDCQGQDNFKRMIELQDQRKFVYDRYRSKASEEDFSDLLFAKEKFRTLTCEGFAKWLLLERIASDHPYYDEILLQLIIVFHSADSMHQYTVRQCLSVFFAAYAQSPHAHHLNVIEKLYLRTLRFVFDSESDAITQIDPLSIGSFLLSLTKPSEDAPLEELRHTTHQQIALCLAKEIANSPGEYQSKDLKTIAVLMSHCSLLQSKYEVLVSLSEYTKQSLENINDRWVKPILTKFKSVITILLDRTDPPTESDEDSEVDNLPDTDLVVQESDFDEATKPSAVPDVNALLDSLGNMSLTTELPENDVTRELVRRVSQITLYDSDEEQKENQRSAKQSKQKQDKKVKQSTATPAKPKRAPRQAASRTPRKKRV